MTQPAHLAFAAQRAAVRLFPNRTNPRELESAHCGVQPTFNRLWSRSRSTLVNEPNSNWLCEAIRG